MQHNWNLLLKHLDLLSGTKAFITNCCAMLDLLQGENKRLFLNIPFVAVGNMMYFPPSESEGWQVAVVSCCS